jgi:uncharacterized membrane protein
MLEFLLGHSLWAFRNGELAFARGWPTWVLGLAILLGIAAIAYTLWRHRLEPLRALAIGTLQAAFLALALILLWRPVLNVEQIRDRENVVAVVMDDSGSMNTSDAADGPTRRAQAVAALDAGVLKEIGAHSELRLFGFSDRARPVDSLQELRGGAPATRVGEALETVTQMAASVPLAAVVVLTDGADTADTLNEGALARLAAAGIPVHAVGVGPEAPDNDLELAQLQVPDSAIAGSTVRANVSILHQKQPGTRVRIYDADKLVAAQEVKFGANPGLATVSVEFPAGEGGVRDLRVTVDGAQGERQLGNNERRAVMEVDARRRAVLYLEGEPRWEYKFIRRAVEGERALRLASAVRATPNRYYRQGLSAGTELENGFPTSQSELFGYDAVIIGSLEAAALSTEQHQWLKDFVDRRGGSLLMLAGRDGLGDGGWSRVPIASLLPAKLPGGNERTYGMRASKVRLTPYGRESPISRLGAAQEDVDKSWQDLPPLADYQDPGALRPGAIVLLESMVGENAAPLLVTQRYGQGATWLLATASTWRWQMQLPLADQRHEVFWRQLLHALAAPAPTRVSLRPERPVYDDDTAVTLEAEVLDEDFKPLHDPQLKVEASSAETGTTVPARIEPSGRGDGRYTVAVDANDPGLYEVRLTATAGGKEAGAAVAHLRRSDGVLEQFASWQHRPMLERIAKETGGRYWSLADIAGLPEAIRYSSVGLVEHRTLDLWNMPLAFLLLALLKGGEWLLRRHWRRL